MSDEQERNADIGAETDNRVDWANLQARLQYYFGISNQEILNHSYACLMLLNIQSYELACENLGVSPNKDENDEAMGKTNAKGNKILAENSYPIEVSRGAKMLQEAKGQDFIDEYLKDFKGVKIDG